MTSCPTCGANIDEGVKFCPSCGADVSGQAQQTVGAQPDANDAQQNKTMAVIAYILFFIPLLTGDYKKSPFVNYHTNQGTVLFLVSLAAQVLASILTFVVIGCFLIPLFCLASLILCIMGIVNAVNGKTIPLPLIGKWTIIK